MKVKTQIVCAFPGTGKTYFCDSSQANYALANYCRDSDSSNFPKENFPQNYIAHIKSMLGIIGVVFVSSHKEVRDALAAEGIEYTLVYPHANLKDEYLKRYEDRGDSWRFISLVNTMWDQWMAELQADKSKRHIVLPANGYLFDAKIIDGLYESTLAELVALKKLYSQTVILPVDNQLGLTKREYIAALIAAGTYAADPAVDVPALVVDRADKLIEALNKKRAT